MTSHSCHLSLPPAYNNYHHHLKLALANLLANLPHHHHPTPAYLGLLHREWEKLCRWKKEISSFSAVSCFLLKKQIFQRKKSKRVHVWMKVSRHFRGYYLACSFIFDFMQHFKSAFVAFKRTERTGAGHRSLNTSPTG